MDSLTRSIPTIPGTADYGAVVTFVYRFPDNSRCSAPFAGSMGIGDEFVALDVPGRTHHFLFRIGFADHTESAQIAAVLVPVVAGYGSAACSG